MGRIADALKRAQGAGPSQGADRNDGFTALEYFSSRQAPATDPWDFGPQVSPGKVDRNSAGLSTAVAAESLRVLTPSGEHDVSTSPELEKLVLDSRIPRFVTEQYRQLCARLHHAQLQRAIKVVMVTSALPAEGKTLTASNLALALSDSYGRRVALIDADLRRPSLHQVFVLEGAAPVNLLPETGSTTFVAVRPLLAVLAPREPAADPLAVLASSRMQTVLNGAREQFDWVVLDTPPAGVLPDASVLSSMVDAVVMVALVGRTPFRAIQQACEAVGRERVLGVVLNRADRRSVAQAAYRYNTHYHA
ncbi:MAG TPA: CpsD/CapB family tyrosine-protein kinase [Vicinamibacterales bacterium]|jgi:receptor protein-tyrosine kinase